jgi:hypothetical protein
VPRRLPPRRAEDGEEAVVTVASSGGFMLRKVFCTVPSRLVGHGLRVRIHDDRLEVFLGATHLMTLPRGPGCRDRCRPHVVDSRHVIHALRAKPFSPKANLRFDGVSRARLPRPASFLRRLSPPLRRRHGRAAGEETACRLVVDALALAHERGCEEAFSSS